MKLIRFSSEDAKFTMAVQLFDGSGALCVNANQTKKNRILILISALESECSSVDDGAILNINRFLFYLGLSTVMVALIIE